MSKEMSEIIIMLPDVEDTAIQAALQSLKCAGVVARKGGKYVIVPIMHKLVTRG